LALSQRFVRFRCARPGCLYIERYNRIDAVIVALYLFQVAVEKIERGNLAAPNSVCQLGSGFE
jgi:hypothetical protein